MTKDVLKNKNVIFALGIVSFFLLSALLAPQLAPNDPIAQSLEHMLLAPCKEFPFGTDEFGRCILSRILYGGRISLLTGIATTLLSAVIGMCLGLISGFNGGIVDSTIMRIVDIFMSFPGLVMALAIAGLLDGGVQSVIIALSLVGWTGFARVVRATVIVEKEKDYIQAARALGAGKAKIYIRHLLPSVLPPFLILASTSVGNNILAAAGLSFLGVGISPPTAEWGAMLSSGKGYISRSVCLSLFPGAAIMLSAVAFNLLGDSLREALDPKLAVRTAKKIHGCAVGKSIVRTIKWTEKEENTIEI